jgi:hypothetical protein
VTQLFAGDPVSETVATRVHFRAGPEAVWNSVVFYEDVPGAPPFLLRALLPRPLRTEGDKTRVGARVRCVYRESDLVKRITLVKPARVLKFEVVEQNLGIEGCVLTQGGSYQFFPCGDGTDVALVTEYRAFLHPRHLWRPVEARAVRSLHRHILDAVRAALLSGSSLTRVALSPSRCFHR